MQESRYRWVIVAAVAAMLGIAFGQIVNGLSVFFLPLEQEFGWARGEIAAINSSGLIGLALGGFLVSLVADRANIRHMALFGTTVIALMVLFAGRASEIWQFYTIFFVAGLMGGSVIYGPLFALIGNWFRTGAGLAIGIAAAGQAMGQGAVPFGTAYLIDWLGWRGAFTALGLFSLVALIPLALLIRPAPPLDAQASAASQHGPYLPTPLVVAALSIAVLGCCTAMSTPLMHLVPLIEGCGFDATQAGGVLFTMMIAAIGGRVAFGKMADMVGALPAYMTAVAWQTALIFFFTQINDLRTFAIFAPIYGFGYGGVMTGLLISVRELTPAARRASATGIVLSFAWAGHGLGGWQGGATFDATGGYLWGFGNAVLAGLVTLAILTLLMFFKGRSRSAVAPAS